MKPSLKRQEPNDDLDQLHPQDKKPKLDDPRTVYWDTLSKIWLTRDALEELCRRNKAVSSARRVVQKALTRPLQGELKGRCQTLVPDPILSCKPECVKEIKRLSRRGGLDLSDITGFPEPHIPSSHSMDESGAARKRSANAASLLEESSQPTKTSKSNTTAYNQNFEQKLIDVGVYPNGYQYSDDRFPPEPNNLDEIMEVLARPRPPIDFTAEAFRKFVRADAVASKENPIIKYIIPALDGDISNFRTTGGEYPFANLAPFTANLVNATPDHFFGALPEQLNREIREELYQFIIPSKQDSLAMLPNFFLEVKGPNGIPIVATRQACHNGALGARGMHKLQSYAREPVYDKNAYTITATYQVGTLKLYTTHISGLRESDGRPEYVMTSLMSYAMTNNLDTFKSGISAYRNARDWAKEQRDEFIKAANERHASRSEAVSSSEPVVLEDSETSGDAEFEDAAEWRFSQPRQGGRGTSKPLN